MLSGKRTLKGLLLGFLSLAPVFLSSNTSASTDITATVSPILQLSVPSSVNISLTPSAGVNSFDSATLTATVGTNNMYGYNLSMSIDNTTISRPNAEQSETGIETLTTKEGGYTEQEFTVNKWGYKLTGDNYFPLETTIAPATWTSNEAAKNNTHNITFAAKVDSSIKAGTYSTTLTFTAVANTPSPSTLADYYALNGKSRKTITADINGDGTTEQVALYKMQDMTPTICSSADEGEIQVIDDRDNKVYWILKAKDGKCWMTQNLDYDIVTTENYYTPDNTDIASNWTPVRATIQPTDINSSTGAISNWTNDNNTPYSVNPGNYYWTDTWYDSSECPSDAGNNYLGCNYLTGGSNGKFNTTAYADNGTHGHVGNYYNWSAATASNDTSGTSTGGTNLATSICPKGWRLPTVASTNEFENLLNAYNAYSTTANYRDKELSMDPLYFVRGGGVWSSALRVAGCDGYYWSSTVNSSARAYRLNFASGGINLAGIGNRFDGKSVRCVARTEADQQGELGTFNRTFYDAGKSKVAVGNNSYYQMQDMSSSICSAVNEGEEAQLLDNRDNKVYWVLKAKDNHCWMTQNLDHDIVITENFYTPDNTDITTSWAPARGTISYTTVAVNGNIPSWVDDSSTPYSFDPGTWYWTDTYYKSSAYNYLANGENDKFKHDPFSGNGEHGHIGNYYNWAAATAVNQTTGANATSSICPKGWRLPDVSSTNEFTTLLNAYDANVSSGTERDQPMSESPLYFVRVGGVWEKALGRAGEYGRYWSGTASAATTSYGTTYSNGLINLKTSWANNNGYSVRCLAR